MDCIFCKIVSGEIPAAKVYEDEYVFAFLDVEPGTMGHTLVIPKEHFENVFDISEDALARVAVAGKLIALQMKKNMGAVGVKLASNNGQKAHQIVPHFHLHVIPRYEDDGLEMYGPRTKDKRPMLSDLEAVAQRIQQS